MSREYKRKFTKTNKDTVKTELQNAIFALNKAYQLDNDARVNFFGDDFDFEEIAKLLEKFLKTY